MKMKELLEKDLTALQHELADRRKHLFALRTQAVTEKLEDPSQLGKTRKEIARLMTAITRKNAEAQKPAAAAAAAAK